MTAAVTGRVVPARLSWIDGVGSTRAVEVLRIAAGPLVIAHLWPFLRDAAAGVVYADRFSVPYASWYPELPRSVYEAALWAAVAAGFLMTAGLGTRAASWYAAAFVGYNLFLSRTHFGHNRAFLLVLLVGLALLPVGRAWSLDAVLRSRRGLAPRPTTGMLWPLALMRFEVAVVFLASGTSKLLDPDWFGGTVTRLRVEQWGDVAVGRGLPSWLVDFAASAGFHAVFAKAAVLTELAIGAGLVFRRTRLGAVWVAVWFHLAIEVFASVQVFSFAALAALVIWVTPAERDRRVVVRGDTAGARLVAGAVRGLDWTGRFRLERESGGGPAVTLVDRDGTTRHGAAAARFVLSRLPATFMPVAPFNLAGLRALWDRRLAAFFAGGRRRPPVPAGE